MQNPERYAYIVGRVRALETNLMDNTALERLLDAKGAAESYRALNDFHFIADYLSDYEVQDFQKVLHHSMRGMKDLLISMSPYPKVLNFLWYKYDFHNLKLVLKAKITNRGYEDVSHALMDLGTVSLESFEKYLLEGTPVELTKDLNSIVKKAEEAYEKEQNPHVIDIIVDQYYLNELRAIVDETNSTMLSNYYSRMIDISNLKAFIRSKELKKDTAYLAKVLVSGGHVDLETFISTFERGYDELKQALMARMHAEDLVIALEEFASEKTLLSLEKKAAERQQYFMNESQKIAFGPEPVFAFFYRFENQLQIVRAVLVGKLNKLPAEEIQQNVYSL